MYLKQKLKNIYVKIAGWPLNKKLSIAAVSSLLLISVVIFLQVKTVQFSYGNDTCVSQITLFPSISMVSGDGPGFKVEHIGTVKLGNLQILSTKTCFTPKKVPSVGETRIGVAPFGGWLARKTFNLVVPTPPVARIESLAKPIPTARPLAINLSSADSVFNYQLRVEGKSTACPAQNQTIYCDITPLKLVQDKTYNIELIRRFGNQVVETLASRGIKTLSATNIVGSSVTQGQVIFNRPKKFSFTFNKEIARQEISLVKVKGGNRTPINIKYRLEGNKSTATISNDLERDSNYEFSIDHLEAKDGSTLTKPYNLSFKMSDGPSVASVNVGINGLPLTQTIILTFDQGFSGAQNVADYISTSGIPASVYRVGNQVFVNYSNAPMCTDLSINVKAGLLSNNNIIQNDSWSFSTRTVCHTTVNIGYSVLGRPIYAYVFGSGGTTILFTGGIHGSEPSGSYIMYDFISYLESNAKKIPVNKKIVVVPSANPDGLASYSRYNSNNVNIDRNFPSSNWRADIDTSSGLIVGGGGSSAMPEPETKALANLTSSLRPRLEVSFHAQGSLVGANQIGDSVSIGNLYASSIGYRSMIGQAEETMGYSITGEYEDWAGEQSIPAILIELPSVSGRYFNAHQSVLWKMVNI